MIRALPLAALAFGGLAALGGAARAQEEAPPRSRYETAVLEALRQAEDCTLINSRLRSELRLQDLTESRKVENAVFALARKGEARLHLGRPERIALRDPACPEDPKPPLEQGAADMRGELTHLLESHDCVLTIQDPQLTTLLRERREDFAAAMGDLFADGDLTQIQGHGPSRIVYRAGDFCADLNPADTREEEIRRLDAAEPLNALRQSLLERAEAGECALEESVFAALAGEEDGVWGEKAEAALLDLAASGDAGRKAEDERTTVLLNVGALCQ